MRARIQIIFLIFVLVLMGGMAAWLCAAVPTANDSFDEAMTYYRAGLWDKALEFLKKSLQENPTASAHHYLGLVYEKKSKITDAIWQWKQALTKDPQLAIACFNIALGYSALKKGEEEVKWYKKAVSLNQNYAKAWNNLGSAYMKQNKNGEAIRSFQKSLEVNPHYAVAAENLALVYEKQKMSKEAKQAWKYAARLETRPAWKRVLEAKAR